MLIDSSAIITAGGVLSAIIAFVTVFWKLFKWIDHQKEQDAEIAKIKAERADDNRAIQDELTLIIYGLQACLQGLREQGCDGPVTGAIDKIDKYINQKAHKA